MDEPTTLTSALTEFVARHPRGSRLHTVGTQILRAHTTNQQRRASVLAHPDLAARLTQPPLNYARPDQWNGYIPPATVDLGESEALRTVGIGGRGEQVVRFNQLGRRTRGEQENDAPERAALLDISREAWERDHADDPSDTLL
jgi:hypothetical protein